ncbi:unnamed protein product [Polarella glacialis]|uniref:MIP18 family-like domain-containing protein n=1 Tax=Polarella glacialis TaxID=89957 RepID=A0A813I342_POLGL|nr:unnamed protein product [Polarella glacialis]
MADSPLIFFPDLQNDFAKDPALKTRYGLCVSSCPAQGDMVNDYGSNPRQTEWLAIQPSFAVFHRCVPYDQPANNSGTLLCAFPACQATAGDPQNPQQVCGLSRDGTSKYWLLERPDWSMQDGWRAEGADEALVAARTAMASTAPLSPQAAACLQRLSRESQVALRPSDAGASYKMFTQITSPAFTFSSSISDNLDLVLGLGLGGAALVSLVIMLLFPMFAQVVLLLLLLLLFTTLIATDYILFVQAGIASGKTGDQFKAFLESNLAIDVPSGAAQLLQQTSNDENMKQLFAWAAFLLAILIAFLVCMVMSMAKQFRQLVALIKEAGNTVRTIPSLIIMPFLLFCSMASFASLLSAGLLGVATARQEKVQDLLDALHMHDAQAFQSLQTGAGFVLLVGFLWIYFFHVAVFTTTVALTVSRWYFRGDLQAHRVCPTLGGCLGLPLVVSLCQVFRYHLGSLALGSLLMTVVTIPRLVLEYIDHHTQEATEQNALARSIMCVTRCLLGCLHCCLKFITEYAYVYVAVVGEPFWRSSKQSFSLFAKYPVQVGLNKLTCAALGYLMCVAVPLMMALVAFFRVGNDWVTFQSCAVAIVLLSYLITRMAVGVYDVCVTTLFVCAMRDEEYCGGEHMTLSLRRACGLTVSGQDDTCGKRPPLSHAALPEVRDALNGTDTNHPLPAYNYKVFTGQPFKEFGRRKCPQILLLVVVAATASADHPIERSTVERKVSTPLHTLKRWTPWTFLALRAKGDGTGTDAPLTAVQEVTRQLREVKDPGLGADVVACGFVGNVKADRETGEVTLGLEVSTYEAQIREQVKKLPWVKKLEIKVRTPLGGKAADDASKSGRPMPKTPPCLENVKSIIGVSSCKGGVGKSTVAVNLAWALHAQGHKVGIFDCDVHGPSLPVMVQIKDNPEPQMRMYQDEEKKKHIVPIVHPETGIKMVSFGYCGKAAVMRGSMVTGLIAQLMTQTDWGELDYLVLDMPPGTGDIHLTLAQVCQITAAVIVTTPQRLSVIDVERGISMFSQLEIPSIAVVQNMSYLVLPDGSKQYVFGRTDAGRNIANTFGIDQVMELPMEPGIAEAGDTGVPFVTNSETAKSAAAEMNRLADAVVSETKKIHENKTRPQMTWDEERQVLRMQLPNGQEFGISPQELRLRDKGAGGATPAPPGVHPAEIRDMGNYAIVIRWSDGVVQVAPHRQLIEGDEKGPMPRILLDA